MSQQKLSYDFKMGPKRIDMMEPDRVCNPNNSFGFLAAILKASGKRESKSVLNVHEC